MKRIWNKTTKIRNKDKAYGNGFVDVKRHFNEMKSECWNMNDEDKAIDCFTAVKKSENYFENLVMGRIRD